MIIQVDENISIEVYFDPTDREEGYQDDIRFRLTESGPKERRIFKADRTGFLLTAKQAEQLVSRVTSSARKYSCWFGRMSSKPLAHFLIGPGPFKWMGIELIIFGPSGFDVVDQILAAMPGAAPQVMETEGIVEQFRLIEPRGMRWC